MTRANQSTSPAPDPALAAQAPPVSSLTYIRDVSAFITRVAPDTARALPERERRHVGMGRHQPPRPRLRRDADADVHRDLGAASHAAATTIARHPTREG